MGSPFLPLFHLPPSLSPSLLPSSLLITPPCTPHTVFLSLLPGLWPSFVNHPRPRLSSGEWGLPRPMRVRCGQLERTKLGMGFELHLERGVCQSGHPGRALGPCLAHAPVLALPEGCCLPSPPTLLSTQGRAPSHTARWTVVPTLAVPSNCKNPHTLRSQSPESQSAQGVGHRSGHTQRGPLFSVSSNIRTS